MYYLCGRLFCETIVMERIYTRLRLLMLSVALVSTALASAQQLRTSYFMDGAQYRLQLNPALVPTRGYVNLPGISNTGASFWSNGMWLSDVLDVLKNESGDDYFIDNRFMGRLKDVNYASLNAATDIIAAGWWHGQTFMTVNLSVRMSGVARVPKALFSFMREVRGMDETDYTAYERHIGGEECDVTAYSELGLGYSRSVTDRLTLGGRIKLLFGLGNARLKVRQLDVHTNLEQLPADYDWAHGDRDVLSSASGTARIDVDADLE